MTEIVTIYHINRRAILLFCVDFIHVCLITAEDNIVFMAVLILASNFDLVLVLVLKCHLVLV